MLKLWYQVRHLRERGVISIFIHGSAHRHSSLSAMADAAAKFASFTPFTDTISLDELPGVARLIAIDGYATDDESGTYSIESASAEKPYTLIFNRATKAAQNNLLRKNRELLLSKYPGTRFPIYATSMQRDLPRCTTLSSRAHHTGKSTFSTLGKVKTLPALTD